MAHPRSAFGALPRGGDASGQAEPVRGVCWMPRVHHAWSDAWE
jgi:hypothetical protein